MGGSFSTAKRWSTFREGTRNSRAPDRVCVDENRANLGSPDTPDRRNNHQSSSAILAKQSHLLRQLIGESQADSAVLATHLLAIFGSIGGVLSAPPYALAKVVNDPAIAGRLAAAKPAVLESLGERVQRIPFDLNDIALQQWITALFKGYRRERIHVALLDKGKRLIFDEHLGDGGLNTVEGSLRQIVRSGMGIDASGVVLMHNHPSGDVRPSATDVDTTRRINRVLSSLDMQLEDHLIVSENKIFSMRGAMLI